MVTLFQKKLSSQGKKAAAAGEGEGEESGTSSSTTVKHQIVLLANFGCLQMLQRLLLVLLVQLLTVQ